MKLPYEFYPSEPSVFMEVYLPKKANFQGTLYETLTQGFNLEVLKAHFRDADKEPKIKNLLSRYYSISKYDEQTINNFQPVFFGYSMYEVDGVFHSSVKGAVEERIQVLRMIFKPNYDFLFETFSLSEDATVNKTEIRILVRSFLRYKSPDVNAFIDSLSKDEMFEAKKKLLYFIDNWIECVCLFVFGYVVYEICAKISTYFNLENIDMDKIEEEIWVTSFWNLGVNRICFTEHRDL